MSQMKSELGDNEFFTNIVTQSADRSINSYRLIKLLMSMKTEENRAEYKSDEEAYFAKFLLSEEEKDMLRNRDYKALYEYGVPMVAIGKIQGIFNTSMKNLTLSIRGQ